MKNLLNITCKRSIKNNFIINKILYTTAFEAAAEGGKGLDLRIPENHPHQERGSRQLFADRGPCLTSKGFVGKCTTFKECYPYFKIPDLGALDGWVLGIYDTCSYTQEDGRLTFGICCADPPKLPPELISGPIPEGDPDNPVIEEPEQQFVSYLCLLPKFSRDVFL